MFFLFSKVLGVLASPHYLALVLLGIALPLHLLQRAPRLRRWLVVAAVLLVWVLGTGVVANLLLYPLETRYPRPPERLERAPAAIIMLTGITDHRRKGWRFDFMEASDRFIEALRLARRYPRARLLITGGSDEIADTRYREGRVLGELARQLGVPKRQLLIDTEARNTRENAVQSDRLLRQAKIEGPLLLVTSAMHMPRAVACFKKVGREVIPWPVDYLRTGWTGSAWLPKPSSLGKSDQALHEYLGWIAYRISGYI